MIKEMKRIGDGDESYFYRKMNDERKQLRKQLTILNQQHRAMCIRLTDSDIKEKKEQLKDMQEKQDN